MIAAVRLDRAPLRLPDLLDARVAADPTAIAFRFLEDGVERAVSNAELSRLARGFAARLLGEAAPGERALLLYAPGFEYVVALLGCAFAGIIAVPLFPPRIARTMPRVHAILRDAGAAVALTSRRFYDRIVARGEPELLDAIRWRVLEPHDDDADSERYDGDRPHGTGDIAVLQYTSGSTGTPKGVVLTHANLLANLAMIVQTLRLTRDEVGFTWLPPYHDMGLIGGTLAPLYAGFPVVVMPPLAFLQRPLTWLKAVARYGATVTGAPNFAYELCAEKLTPERAGDLDLSALRVAFVGAEPVRAATLDRFATAFAPYGFRRAAFAPCYGLAEATLLVSGGFGTGPTTVRLQRAALAAGQVAPAGDDDASVTLVSSGPVAAGAEVGIFDLTGAPAAAGEIGEICVRGPAVAAGYWNRPEQTAETFRALDGGAPYLCTGDLGYLADGELFVTGRRKEILIVRGRNVYPRDVEEVAGRAHPLVHPDGCVAFAVDTPAGDGLVIVAEHSGTPPPAEIEAARTAIRAAVTSDLDVAPAAVVLARSGTIPRTSSGKLQRLPARDRYLDGSLGVKP